MHATFLPIDPAAFGGVTIPGWLPHRRRFLDGVATFPIDARPSDAMRLETFLGPHPSPHLLPKMILSLVFSFLFPPSPSLLNEATSGICGFSTMEFQARRLFFLPLLDVATFSLDYEFFPSLWMIFPSFS